jgi:hypothetical protein
VEEETPFLFLSRFTGVGRDDPHGSYSYPGTYALKRGPEECFSSTLVQIPVRTVLFTQKKSTTIINIKEKYHL